MSARTLRYYEELGLLTPSLYTAGGERRYTLDDLAHLQRILELREVLGDEPRRRSASSCRSRRGSDELRAVVPRLEGRHRARRRWAEQKATLQEAMELQRVAGPSRSTPSCARMDGFRAKLLSDAQRCRELLGELE